MSVYGSILLSVIVIRMSEIQVKTNQNSQKTVLN